MSSPYGPAAPIRPATSPRPSWVPWLLAGIGAAVETAVVLVVTVLIGIFRQTCGTPATSQTVLHGELSFALVALVAMTPWLLSCLWSRHRLMLGVYAVAAASPALFFLAVSTHRSAWEGCLFTF